MPAKHGAKVGPCTGKKFLVTGGARGIGRGVVEELYAQGATVYALSRSPDTLKALKDDLPLVNTICVDVADWDATRKAVENLEPMDCLINNAGIMIQMNFMDINPEGFDKLMNVNLKSVINISQVISKKMIEAGKGGAIVNISSIMGKRASADSIPYCCSKSALQMLSKGMALELAKHKITVNTVCPAGVDTDMVKNALEALGDKAPSKEAIMEFMRNKTPTGAAFMPMSDIVNTILFFGSNVTSQITGEDLLVDGGLAIAF